MIEEGFLMKKSKYIDAQIMTILKQAESGGPGADLCREHGMSSARFYKWRSKYEPFIARDAFAGRDLSATAERPNSGWQKKSRLLQRL